MHLMWIFMFLGFESFCDCLLHADVFLWHICRSWWVHANFNQDLFCHEPNVNNIKSGKGTNHLAKKSYFLLVTSTLVKGNIFPKKKLCRKIWPGCQLKLTWKYNSHMTNLMTFEQFCNDNFFAQHKHLGLFSPWRSWGPACPSWDTAWPPSTSAVS